MDVTDILKGFPNTGHDVRVDARGKGGVGPWAAEGESIVHDKGYYHSYCRGEHAARFLSAIPAI